MFLFRFLIVFSFVSTFLLAEEIVFPKELLRNSRSFRSRYPHKNSYPVYSNEIDLSRFERSVYSQNGEDGIIQTIFQYIGNSGHYFVEFGANDGHWCSNTRFLSHRCGWNGLLLDGDFENSAINLHKEFITAENINQLFEKYHVPNEFDLLSIDIDFNDFYVWQALDKKYRPRLVVIEYNATHFPNEDHIVQYDPFGQWDYTNYFGASILSLYKLGRSKGYSLVYAESKGVNLFFVRDDLLNEIRFKHMNDVTKLYQPPKYGSGPNGGHPADPQNRPWVGSQL